jgi:hypothetical protein
VASERDAARLAREAATARALRYLTTPIVAPGEAVRWIAVGEASACACSRAPCGQ